MTDEHPVTDPAELPAGSGIELLRAVVDTLDDGVVVLDGNGHVLIDNRASRRLLGVLPRSSGERRWPEPLEVLLADGVTPCRPGDLPTARARADGVRQDAEVVVRTTARPGGLRIAVSARPLDPTAGAGGGAVVALLRELTARDPARPQSLPAELPPGDDQHERLLGMLSELGEGVVIAEGTHFVYVNAAYAALTGYTPAELVGMDTTTVAADAAAAGDFASMREQLSGGPGSTSVVFTRLRHRDGHTTPVETMGLSFDDGGVRRRVCVVRDISERRRVQAELAERAVALESANRELTAARDAAAAASRAKSAFLATMSHEIRTPLHAVIGLTEIVLGSDLEAEQREHLETVRASGDSLIKLINDILDWSKIESGALDLELRPFGLRDCLRSVVAGFAAETAAKNLQLLTEVAAGCPELVLGDVTRVRQILANLVSNAVKFTTAGQILVRAAPPADPGRTGGLPGGRGRAPGLRLTVTDTGIGIPAAKMGRLFRDFSQVDDSTTRLYGGTGLGLAISRRLAEVMGGLISVTSVPGTGSTFTVDLPLVALDSAASPRLPAAAVPAEHTGSLPSLPALSGAGLRVLLVEDNAVNRTVARLMLDQLGYAADVAVNGAEAVGALARAPYDVVLMDVQMPVLDGLEATRRLRAEPPPGPRPWIIAVTANALADDRERCAAAGMDDYLSKPVRRQDLAAVLGRTPQLR